MFDGLTSLGGAETKGAAELLSTSLLLYHKVDASGLYPKKKRDKRMNIHCL